MSGGRLISPVYGFGSDGRRERRAFDRPTRTVRLEVETLEALLPAAREREISVTELVQKLLDRIAMEKTVTAVLDDEAELRARKGGSRSG